MAVVALRGVVKGFRGNAVLSEVDFDLMPGTVHAICGPNGSGKSVMLKLVCGLLRPDAGEVLFDPHFMSPGRSFPQDFGIVIDGPGYIAGATGYGNLERLADIRGVIGRSEIVAAMRLVGLDPAARQKVRDYSLGMKQRLALAQAFMEGQRVLILDEPFNALDSSGAADVRELIVNFRAEGRTVLFTSHSRDDVDALADSVSRVDGGTLIRVR